METEQVPAISKWLSAVSTSTLPIIPNCFLFRSAGKKVLLKVPMFHLSAPRSRQYISSVSPELLHPAASQRVQPMLSPGALWGRLLSQGEGKPGNVFSHTAHHAVCLQEIL